MGTLPLTGSITDDGGVLGYVVRNWSQLDGRHPISWAMQNGVILATFPRAGTYTLRLTAFDGEFTITDDVQVTATGDGIILPALAWADPQPPVTARAFDEIPLRVTATPGDHPIDRVIFLVNGTRAGLDRSAPYAMAWVPTGEGLYAVEAVAVDSAGLMDPVACGRSPSAGSVLTSS